MPAGDPMTSTSTFVERLRRAANSGEPMRDVAVVMSEFIDDGGVELVDDPFHPARKDPVDGLVAIIASTEEISVILVRSAAGLVPVPQRHELPVAVGVLAGRLMVDVYLEEETQHTVSRAEGVEVFADEVYVIQPDVIHNIGFVGEEPGLALHVIVGDLDSVERSRWIDGQHERLAPSRTYPLPALPMLLALPVEPDPSQPQTPQADSPQHAPATD